MVKDKLFPLLSFVDFLWEWASSRKKLLGVVFAIIVCGVILLARNISSSSGGAPQGKVTSLSHWLSDSSSEMRPQDVIKAVKSSLAIQDRFGGQVSQKLLFLGETNYPQQYLKKTIPVLSQHCPYYQRFSETSLLIATHQFQEALEQAKNLKLDLETDRISLLSQSQDGKSAAYLYVLNLLRIGVLQKKLDLSAQELATWGEMEGILVGNSSTYLVKQACVSLMLSFKDEDLTLQDFIKERKRTLAKKI